MEGLGKDIHIRKNICTFTYMYRAYAGSCGGYLEC